MKTTNFIDSKKQQEVNNAAINILKKDNVFADNFIYSPLSMLSETRLQTVKNEQLTVIYCMGNNPFKKEIRCYFAITDIKKTF